MRKRRTEVDALMGPVVEFGRECGIDTPAIRRLIALVHDVENGQRVQSWQMFRVLMDEMPQVEVQGVR